jgi:hypothetical protein
MKFSQSWKPKLILIGGLLALAYALLPYRKTVESASLDIDANQTALSIPPTYLGFSYEWGETREMMGVPSTGINAAFRQLLRNLFEYGGGPPVIRIGGSSTDSLGSNGEPDAEQVGAFALLAEDLGAQFYLSVNLGTGSPELAGRQARFFIEKMPKGSLRAIEIGNEPDVYQFNGLRSHSYSVKDYLRELGSWQSGLQPELSSGMKLMGPSWALTQTLGNLPEFLNAGSGRLSTVSQHWYAGYACGGKTNPPDILLDPTSASSGAEAVAPAVSLAHAKGLAFRIGEMNSIACNGQLGVSDTFASALWMIDALFEFAKRGVDGVNVHMDVDDVYGPFIFKADTSRIPYRYSVSVTRPEYYGLLFFQQAAPGGSRMVRAQMLGAANVKGWATIDDKQTLRITIINDDKVLLRRVSVKVKDYEAAYAVRLVAPSYHSKSGISLGGVTFDGTTDGKALGTPKRETLLPRGGVYEVQVPPTSAILLTLEHS